MVDIVDGVQTIEVIATDRLGNTSTEIVDVVGLADGPVDPTQFSQIADNRAVFEYTRTSFNRQTSELIVDYAVTNVGTPSIGNGALALFDGFNPTSVAVNDADGSLPGADGNGYFVLDAEIPTDGLRSGQTSAASSIHFSNPNRARFDFDAQVLTQQNAAPVFDSIPVVIATANAAYSYAANAVDPNGQAVTYSLLTAPAGLTIDPDTGLINWQPTVNDVASHSIQILADDGEGGTTIQPFILTVTSAAPDNRGPVITSPASDTFSVATAVSVAGTNQFDYSFSAAALDPDGDSITWSVAGGARWTGDRWRHGQHHMECDGRRPWQLCLRHPRNRLGRKHHYAKLRFECRGSSSGIHRRGDL